MALKYSPLFQFNQHPDPFWSRSCPKATLSQTLWQTDPAKFKEVMKQQQEQYTRRNAPGISVIMWGRQVGSWVWDLTIIALMQRTVQRHVSSLTTFTTTIAQWRKIWVWQYSNRWQGHRHWGSTKRINESLDCRQWVQQEWILHLLQILVRFTPNYFHRSIYIK